MTIQEKLEVSPKLPYGGLFGDSNLIKVIEQVMADPDIEYRPIDLEKLTKESPPTVRASLKILTSQGLLFKDETDRQHPVYRVNTESKRFVALTFLAYAVLDDMNGTDSMNKIIEGYCGFIAEKPEESKEPVMGGDPKLVLPIDSVNSVVQGVHAVRYINGPSSERN
jgi:DNA-binding transcriptional ArsR family regulator